MSDSKEPEATGNTGKDTGKDAGGDTGSGTGPGPGAGTDQAGSGAPRNAGRRKARVIEGTAEEVAGEEVAGEEAAGGQAGGTETAVPGRALTIALPVFAFFAGAAVLAAVLWQTGLLAVAGGPVSGDRSRLDAAETRVEALLRDVDRLGSDLRAAQEARDGLAARLSEAEAALEAAGAQPPESLARAEDLDAALRLVTEIETRVSEAEAALAGQENAVAPARVAALETRLETVTERLDGMQAAVARAAEADRRIAAIETGISAVGARQETLAGEVGEVRTRIGAVQAGGEAASAGLAAQGARLDTLADGMAALDARLAVTESRVDRPEAARRAALGIALASLSGAVIDGDPFAAELEAVRALAPEAAGADALAAHAATGVPDAAVLLTRFRPAAREALRAEAAARGDGLWDRLTGNALSLVTVRETGAVEGEGTEAALARAEAALLEDEVAEAVSEVSSLDGAAAEAMAGWLETAAARARAERLVAELRTSLLTDLARAHGTASGTGPAGSGGE